jgi:hypothetical protein
MLAPRQHQRVNHALGIDWLLGRAQLGIEKGDIKVAWCATSGVLPKNARNSSTIARNSYSPDTIPPSVDPYRLT